MTDDLDVIRQACVDRCDDLAIALLGNPTSKSRNQLRWGAHGKIRLKLLSGRWKDFSTGEWGDMLDLAKRELGISFIEAVEWASGQLAIARPKRREYVFAARPQDEDSERAAHARTTYLNAKPANAMGAGYFAARGLDYPEVLAKQLRIADVHLFGFDGHHRALLMPVRDFATLEVQGVHRIALATRHPDGKRVKQSLGRMWGSAMMLGRPKDGVLGICEGLETGVAILAGDPGVPVWCLSGTAFMAGFEPIEGVKRLIIYADHDDNGAGEKAAAECSRLWRRQATVEVVVPGRAGSDFADIWRRV